MIYKVLFAILFVGIQIFSYGQPYKIEEGVKRIVFVGNSITYAGGYVNYIDTYLSIRYPKKNYEIINLGLPSETVSGLSEPNHANGAFPRPNLHDRLESLLNKTKPDLIFACYGMNDGIYMPLDETRFKKFRDGISRLHSEVVKQEAEIIHLTPPIYDGQKGKTYSDVLEVYSDWLMEQKRSSGWNVIDIHHPMKQELKIRRLKDPNFSFAKDGVHPNMAGHFIMAKAVLLSFGAEEFAQAKDFEEVLYQHKNGAEVFTHIQTRQRVSKDAWLTYVGHQRPKMNLGLSMEEARNILQDFKIKIQVLMNE